MKKNYLLKTKLSALLFGTALIAASNARSQTLIVQNFAYTGGSQSLIIPACSSPVTIEVWGAEGGGSALSGNGSSGPGGKGGYAAGVLNATPGSTLNVYVGGYGLSSTSGSATGGFNGGGSGYASSSSEPGNGGGGGTDVRVNSHSLTARVIVAGGGGGGGEDSGDPYGHGGGYTGVGYNPYDGTQTAAGQYGGFGFGATTNQGDGGGGGGGWYGGGKSYTSTSVGDDTQGGGGGSGYVGTLTSTNIIAGNSTMPNPSGGTMSGRSGHGYARISYSVNGAGVSLTTPTTAICTGASLTMYGSGVSTYTWLPAGSFGGSNSATINVSPTASTVYTLQGTNPEGCISTKVVSITVNTSTPVLSVTSSTNSTCLGKAVVLTATGGLTHSWSGGITNGVAFTPTATTVYTVSGNNACGTSTTTSTITIVPLPVGVSASSTLVCQLNPVTLTAAGGTGYTWTPGNMTSTVVIVGPSANTIYTVSATDGTCIGTATVGVNTNPNPTITIAASSSAVCEGLSATLTATGANSYTWSNAPITGNTGVVTPTSSTLYQVTGSNQFGCITGASQVVIVHPKPGLNAVANKTLVCSGGSSTLTASGNSDVYSWSTGGSGNSIVVSPGTSSTYTVTGTINATGCMSEKTVSVNVYEGILQVSPSSTICEGSSITLTAGPGTGYQWNPGPSSFPNVTVKPLVPTTYTVSAMTTSNSIICLSSNTIHVGVNPKPVITAQATRTVMCRSKESVTLTAGGASTYLWLNNNSTNASIVFTTNLIQTHVIQVTGTDANGCKDTAAVSVKVDACAGLEKISGSAALNVYPNPNSGSFTVKGTEGIQLTVSNELGQIVRVISLTAENNFTANMEDLSAGIYFITGQSDGRVYNEKIIVRK